MTDIVLGAGIVGIATALQLQRRGRDVVLIDKGLPGQATSFGNAGLLERADVMPRTFPRRIGELLPYALGTDMRGTMDMKFFPRIAPFLLRYWYESAPNRVRRTSDQLATIFVPSVDAHTDLMTQADALHLFREDGWMHLFRNAPVSEGLKESVQRAHDYGMRAEIIDGDEVAAREPALKKRVRAAVHWRDSASISDPGELSRLYAQLFERLGGSILTETVQSIGSAPGGWRVKTDKASHEAENMIVAMGVWSRELVRPLGYRIPMEAKRGYHMHFSIDEADRPKLPVIDDAAGIALSPMTKGIRMTTGIEFASRDAAPNPRQVDHAEPMARELFALGGRVDNAPWLGNRPATADMKPVIGPAPHHKGLWFAFGHAHHGLTLGAVTGKMLAEAIVDGGSSIPMEPFSAGRFG